MCTLHCRPILAMIMPMALATLLFILVCSLVVLWGIWTISREIARVQRSRDRVETAAERSAPVSARRRRKQRQAATDSATTLTPGNEAAAIQLPRSQQLLAVFGLLVLLTVGVGMMYTDPSVRIHCARVEMGAPVDCSLQDRFYWLIPLRTQAVANVVSAESSARTEVRARSNWRGGEAAHDADPYVTVALTDAQSHMWVVETEAEFAPWLHPDAAIIQALIDDPAQQAATIWAIPQLTSVLGVLMPGAALLVLALWLLGAGRRLLRRGDAS